MTSQTSDPVSLKQMSPEDVQIWDAVLCRMLRGHKFGDYMRTYAKAIAADYTSFRRARELVRYGEIECIDGNTLPGARGLWYTMPRCVEPEPLL